MNKIFICLTIGLLSFCVSSFAQEAIWGNNNDIVSPDIHPNNTVTFRYLAPNAKEVKLIGDCVSDTTAMMKDNASGVWSYTTPSLPSELYNYSFLVDGLKVTDPNNVYVNRDVSSVFNIFIVGNGKGDLYSVGCVMHGSVTKRWYASPGNAVTPRRLTIYTPPGYEIGKDELPVLYLLHGMGGDEEAWATLGRTFEIIDNLIAQGSARPMIIVMPNGNMAQEAAPGESCLGFYKPTMMLPHTMDGKMEETFPDIQKFVESNYRVIRKKEGRAIAGLSMGGFHSLHISRYYPNTFDYVGLFSPAINPRESESKVYANIDATLNAQRKNGVKLYWIAIGSEDFLYKDVEKFRFKLDQIDMNYTYHESEGGHTWRNWRDYLTLFLPQLFR